MKLMRVASIALAAYLVSSALRMSITSRRSWLRMKGAYSARISSDRALVVGADHDAVGPHEVLDRGAFLQELGVARPRAKSARRRRAAASSRATAARTLSAVPTGTVLLSTTTL